MIALFIAFSFTGFLQETRPSITVAHLGGFSLQEEVTAVEGKQLETTTSQLLHLENSSTTDTSLVDYLVLHNDRSNKTLKSLETNLSATTDADNKNLDYGQELTTAHSSLENDTLNLLFTPSNREVPVTTRSIQSQQRSLNIKNLFSFEDENRTKSFLRDDARDWRQQTLNNNIVNESSSKFHALSSDRKETEASKNFTTLSSAVPKYGEARDPSAPVRVQHPHTSNAEIISDRIVYYGNETKGNAGIYISSSFVTSKLDAGHDSPLGVSIKANATESSIPLVSFIPFLAKDAITANSTISYSTHNESLINDYENIEYRTDNDPTADQVESKELSVVANSFKPNAPNFAAGIEESRQSIHDRASERIESSLIAQSDDSFKRPEMKDHCLINGKLYNNGEFLKQKDDCTVCRCYLSNVVCHKTECPLTPSGCSEKKQDGFCCPSITCEKAKLESDENLHSIHEMRPSATTILPILRSQPKNSNRALEDLKSIPPPNLNPLPNQSVEVSSTTSFTRGTVTVTSDEMQSNYPAGFSETPSKPLGISFSNSLIASLKLSGCNIYGKTYRVGRIIGELTGPCNECKCTEIGITCLMKKC